MMEIMTDNDYIVTKTGEKYKILKPSKEDRENVKRFHDYLKSIEGQAVHIIYNKYKRTHELDLGLLKNVVLAISEERKKKKEPNVDFLTQKLSEFVKNHCVEYE